MVNTMADLREEVASRLRNSMHGREIETDDIVEPRVPHMLGITPLGKIHDPVNEEMTLMDTNHPFWQDYEEDISTQNAAMEKIETAIRSLREDDIFRMNYPYGETWGDVVYVEVEKLHPTASTMKTSCKECGAEITTSPNLEHNERHYFNTFKIDCPECEFTGNYDNRLIRR